MKAEPIVRRALTALGSIEAAVAVGGLAVTGTALVADIFAREVLGASLFGSLRVAVYGTAVAALVGFVLSVGANSHLRVTVLDNVAPPRWRPAIARTGDLISFIICGLFAAAATQFVYYTFYYRETDVALNILIWPMQLALPWMFVSGGVRFLCYFLFPSLKPAEAEIAQ